VAAQQATRTPAAKSKGRVKSKIKGKKKAKINGKTKSKAKPEVGQ
jgi:hypothetical protein